MRAAVGLVMLLAAVPTFAQGRPQVVRPNVRAAAPSSFNPAILEAKRLSENDFAAQRRRTVGTAVRGDMAADLKAASAAANAPAPKQFSTSDLPVATPKRH